MANVIDDQALETTILNLLDDVGATLIAENGRLRAEIERLKDALVGAIGSPKDRDRMHEVIPLVLASYRERGERAEARLAKVEKLHEALLNTLAPSKSSWIQHIVRNARAALAAAKGEKP